MCSHMGPMQSSRIILINKVLPNEALFLFLYLNYIVPLLIIKDFSSKKIKNT